MKLGFWANVALAGCIPSIAAAQYSVHWAAPAPAGAASSYFPMGMPLQLTTRTELNTKEARSGDRFYLEVAQPLVYHGEIVVPVGSIAVGEVMRSERNGNFGKRGEIEVRLDYVETPSGPVRISGRSARQGLDQGVLAIGGALFISWPMMFIHGTSGRLPADTPITAYLADDLHFTAHPAAAHAAFDGAPSAPRVLPARFDPSVFSANQP
ncbi:hypothetical protein [Sphingomonas sp. PAMC 26605]|uniref:hypothetical protein n=1 Tax=Sphingomonas sp. PAMC 26605 TaxID=1112214 RepID=UPI00026CD6F1|nr:hypothetical protein [Sphingomonas sp. PAMC 26605]